MAFARAEFTLLLLLACIWSGAAQQQGIPPSAFIIAGGNVPVSSPSPPPPVDLSSGVTGTSPGSSSSTPTSPTPPSSPPPTPASSPPPSSPPPPGSSPPPPPATAPAKAPEGSAAGGQAAAASSGSSGISGGAVAGIIIGALAGVALLAFLAFFLLRRRRRRRPAEELAIKEPGAEPLANKRAPTAPSTAGSGLAGLQSGYGLSWKEGDDLRDTRRSDAIRSLNTIPQLDESLADVPLSNTSAYGGGSRKSIGKPPISQRSTHNYSQSAHMSVEERSTTVGPPPSVKINRVPPGSTGNTSYFSNSTQNSQAVSLGSASSSGVVRSSSMNLPELPWSDWQITADEIIMAKDETGAPLKLGSGAYGTVYKATIDGVTEVAVKMFHDIHSAVQQNDILREVAILKSCRDRNIVQFLGACIMDERILLVTELMEAGDLWHALVQYHDTGALSWYKRGKQIAIEVARGLHFLHKHKIIHFDLKSANVLLTRDGTAKISDVGFANILSNTHLSNNATAFTFAWAAPEVLMGAACTEKVDIFSYGVLMWELVTGEQPKRGQLRECRVPEECPAEVEELIQQCLSFQPEERPSCKEIVEVLTRLQNAPGPASSVGGSTPPGSRRSMAPSSNTPPGSRTSGPRSGELPRSPRSNRSKQSLT